MFKPERKVTVQSEDRKQFWTRQLLNRGQNKQDSFGLFSSECWGMQFSDKLIFDDVVTPITTASLGNGFNLLQAISINYATVSKIYRWWHHILGIMRHQSLNSQPSECTRCIRSRWLLNSYWLQCVFLWFLFLLWCVDWVVWWLRVNVPLVNILYPWQALYPHFFKTNHFWTAQWLSRDIHLCCWPCWLRCRTWCWPSWSSVARASETWGAPRGGASWYAGDINGRWPRMKDTDADHWMIYVLCY